MIVQSGEFDATLCAWFGAGADQPGTSDFYECGGLENFTGYRQRLLTSELRSSLIVDERRRAAVLRRADKLLAENVPVIPLFDLPAMVSVRTTVHGFVSDFGDPTWNAENWWLDR